MNSEERRRLMEERKESTTRTVRLWCKDEWRDFKVWRVPVQALILNVDNRRHAAERKLMEEKLGHPLDPENNPNDEISLISILLDKGIDVDGDRVVGKPSPDYESLKRDWLKRKQETPFWVRPDGSVPNGNRRLAMLYRLQRDDGLEGFEWVDAIFIEHDVVDEQDLFDMEQHEQLTENLKVRYTDINLLLTLRDAAIAKGIDWADPNDIDRVAGLLQQVAGGDKDYAKIQLQAIRYMDAYLEDSKAAGQYQKLFRQVERFRDVGKIMAKVETDYPDDAADMLRLAFSAIRAGNPHGDIRALRKMFIEDRPRYQALRAQIEEAESPWEQATGSQLADPDLSAEAGDEDEDDDADSEPPGPVVPNYPAEAVKRRLKIAIDGFLAASSEDVLSNLEQVQNRLEALTDERKRLDAALHSEHAAAVKEALTKVVQWVDRVRAHLAE
jgi:hypothetical protein